MSHWMFHKARRRGAHPSLVLTAVTVVLFVIVAFFVPLHQAKAEDTGNYYYDRYALPWVQRYAPPDTAPGTYGRPTTASIRAARAITTEFALPRFALLERMPRALPASGLTVIAGLDPAIHSTGASIR